jgi:alditol oxidase
MGFTPSSGAEIQSEYLVPRRHGIATIEALRALAGRIRPVLQVAEIRTIARDGLWMSSQYGEDTIAIHFTWKPDQAAVEGVLADMESSLERFEARPHWGKLFLADAAAIAPLYPRLPDFRRLVERLDRRGAFRNRWLEIRVLGPA